MPTPTTTSESRTLKIACAADLHGHLFEPVDCDLVIVAGDVCPDDYLINQYRWLEGKFKPWAEKFKRLVWVAGNHDFACENRVLVPSVPHYLQDSSAEFENMSIWGTPWSLPYGRYAFMAEEEYIARRLEGYMAQRSEILVSHGPPYGVADRAPRLRCVGGYEHAGSRALAHVIEQVQPALCVTGHIHEERGIHRLGRTVVVNAAMTTGRPLFESIDEPIMIELSMIDGRLEVVI